MTYITIYGVKDGWLDEAMGAVGITGVELAHLLAVPVTTVSRWRSTRVSIRRPQAIGLAAVLRAVARERGRWTALKPYLWVERRGLTDG